MEDVEGRHAEMSTIACASAVLLQTGRVHMLPPVRQPLQRPTLFFLF